MKITVSPTVPEELDGICTIENASFSDPWKRSKIPYADFSPHTEKAEYSSDMR